MVHPFLRYNKQESCRAFWDVCWTAVACEEAAARVQEADKERAQADRC
jgi:hypothetical protein